MRIIVSSAMRHRMRPFVRDAAWFCKAMINMRDEEFFDFDQQSERLTSHGQEYLQITKGRFRGRFVSCALSPQATLNIEYANQALSHTIKGANDV